MKVKFYIITYNNNTLLNDWILNTLNQSDYPQSLVDVYVINNHSNIVINDQYKPFVTVLDNVLRPDFSTGHLARNYNQAIINGFNSLVSPDCDVVVACQNDTKLQKNWYESLKLLTQTYTYVAVGCGDQFQMFTAEGITRIGLYDERFCNIGHQEADYFLRAYIYNKDKSSINDWCHSRTHNITNLSIIESTPSGGNRGEPSHLKSLQYHCITDKVFHEKWGESISTHSWDINKHHTLVTQCKAKNYVYYPYFEKDVYDLAGKNYVI